MSSVNSTSLSLIHLYSFAKNSIDIAFVSTQNNSTRQATNRVMLVLKAQLYSSNINKYKQEKYIDPTKPGIFFANIRKQIICKIEAKSFKNGNEHSPMTTAMQTMNIYATKR